MLFFFDTTTSRIRPCTACCPRWATGDPSQIFEETPAVVIQEDEPNVSENDQQEGRTIPDHVYHLGADIEDIVHIRGLGFTVDDDNEPVPENIPDANAPEQPVQETWGMDGIDNFFKTMPNLAHGLEELPPPLQVTGQILASLGTHQKLE